MAQKNNKSGRDTKLVAVTNDHLRDFIWNINICRIKITSEKY
jgi:hypothetical protein